jgi:MFS family permease
VLFLGFPTYALSVVLFALLIFTGIGSAISGRLPPSRRSLTTVLAVAVGLIVVAAPTLQPLLRSLIDQPFATRVVLTILILAPIGLILGMPMPIGLTRFSALYPRSVPYAWGVNGIASVLASVLGIAIAINVGYVVASLVAGACYAGALAHAALGRWSASSGTGDASDATGEPSDETVASAATGAPRQPGETDEDDAALANA